jgi:hypothetical protein
MLLGFKLLMLYFLFLFQMALELHASEQDVLMVVEDYGREDSSKVERLREKRRGQRKAKARFNQDAKERLREKESLIQEQRREIVSLQRKVEELERKMRGIEEQARPVQAVRPLPVRERLGSRPGTSASRNPEDSTQPRRTTAEVEAAAEAESDRRWLSSYRPLPELTRGYSRSVQQTMFLGSPVQPPSEALVEQFAEQLRNRLGHSQFFMPKRRDLEHPKNMWEHLLEFLERTRRPRIHPA